MGDAAVVALASNCTALQHLQLDEQPDSGKLSCSSICEMISQCSQLQRLDLRMEDCRISLDELVGAVAINCPLLHTFHVSAPQGNGGNLTDVGVAALAQNCSQLQHIALAYQDGITDQGILEVATHCSQLRRISLEFIGSRKDEPVVALVSNCHLLECLELDSSDITDTSLHVSRCTSECIGLSLWTRLERYN